MSRSLSRTLFGLAGLSILAVLGIVPTSYLTRSAEWGATQLGNLLGTGPQTPQGCIAGNSRSLSPVGSTPILLTDVGDDPAALSGLMADIGPLLDPAKITRLTCDLKTLPPAEVEAIAARLRTRLVIWSGEKLGELNLTYASTGRPDRFQTLTFEPPQGAARAQVAAAFVASALNLPPRAIAQPVGIMTDGLPARQRAAASEALGLLAATEGQTKSALQAFETAATLYATARDEMGFARANGHMADILAQDPAKSADAIAAYQRAITAQRYAQAPLEWADLQFRLANLLRLSGEQRGDIEAIEQSVATHRVALAERPRETVPLLWAQSQQALGQSLIALGTRQVNPAILQDAINALKGALEVQAARQDDGRIGVMIDLARALHRVGLLRHRAQDVTDAARTYQDTLALTSPADAPALWQQTQTELGATLEDLWHWFGQTSMLAKAAEAYRAALLPDVRDRDPAGWSALQSRLARVLYSLGEVDRSPGWLEQSADASRAALLELSRSRNPQEWAQTKAQLGHALLSMGITLPSTDLLDQAETAYRDAMKVPEPQLPALERARILLKLATGELARHDLTMQKDDLARAWRAALEARAIFARIDAPQYLHRTDQLIRTLSARNRG